MKYVKCGEQHWAQFDDCDTGDEVLSNLKNLMKGAAKKKVLRPQPKLNADR